MEVDGIAPNLEKCSQIGETNSASPVCLRISVLAFPTQAKKRV
jgi:hypothetical protein